MRSNEIHVSKTLEARKMRLGKKNCNNTRQQQRPKLTTQRRI